MCVSSVSTARVLGAADKGFVAKPETYDQIYAFAGAMGWMEEPFHWVASQWVSLLDSGAAKHPKGNWFN